MGGILSKTKRYRDGIHGYRVSGFCQLYCGSGFECIICKCRVRNRMGKPYSDMECIDGSGSPSISAAGENRYASGSTIDMRAVVGLKAE